MLGWSKNEERWATDVGWVLYLLLFPSFLLSSSHHCHFNPSRFTSRAANGWPASIGSSRGLREEGAGGQACAKRVKSGTTAGTARRVPRMPVRAPGRERQAGRKLPQIDAALQRCSAAAHSQGHQSLCAQVGGPLEQVSRVVELQAEWSQRGR